MPGKKFNIDETYHTFWLFKDKADKFLISKKGNLFRIGVLAAITASYPLANIIASGPLLSTIFPWRYKVITQLPDHLKKSIDQQSFLWLEKEGGSETDTFFSFTCQMDAHRSLDSVKIGTLSSVTGAQIALPFYAQFRNQKDALDYAKKYLEPFDVFGKISCVIWESEIGQQLLSTFVLSDNALAFLIARDLYGVQKPYLLTKEAFTWFCHVLTYMMCFYALHVFAFNSDAIVFAVALPILILISFYSAYEWNKLAIYVNEHHADVMAANLSTKHTEGGKEFYTKFLLRNRILRESFEDGQKLFTPIGDLKRSIAKYVTRYDGINGVSSENQELILSIAGDDLPESF